ncbi:hypothetical protein ACFQT0_04540 [Hymenobacter humi]|uniref:DUF1080 domain-containing protein n=1 Tax=Hymenobacter humi TaxID=1411620 RepID=A0ABW2U077_9BACT
MAAGALLVGAAACSSASKEAAAPANLVTRNDFETMEGWGLPRLR